MDNGEIFTNCVKCSTPKTKGAECLGCGVIYAKAEAKHKEDLKNINKAKKDLFLNDTTNSKLTTCEACAREISKNAESCPHCGEPIIKNKVTIKPEKKENSKIGCLGLIFLLGVIIYFSNYSNKTTPSNISPPVIQPSPKELAMKDIALDFKWSKAGFGSIMEIDFTITNKGKTIIKDIEISCTDYAKSGTVIDTNNRTIFDIVNPGETKKFDKFNMGFIHSQTDAVSCRVTDVKI